MVLKQLFQPEYGMYPTLTASIALALPFAHTRDVCFWAAINGGVLPLLCILPWYPHGRYVRAG